jgi:hypothetical protein
MIYQKNNNELMLDKILKLFKIRFEGEMILRDGTPIIVSGDFGVGVTVSVNGPDGIIPLPAGSYELEDGTVFTVDENGVITDIVEQVATPEEPDVETPVPVEEEIIEEPVVEEPEVEPVETPVVDPMMIEELINKIKELEAKIKVLEDKTVTLSTQSQNFESELGDIKTKAHFVKEITKNTEVEVTTGNKNIDLINKIKSIKK